MARCPICGADNMTCAGSHVAAFAPIDMPNRTEPKRSEPMANKLTRVRTGPSSYLEFNDADLKEWRKSHKEWEASVAEAEVPATPGSDVQAVESPVAEKRAAVPAEKKSGR